MARHAVGTPAVPRAAKSLVPSSSSTASGRWLRARPADARAPSSAHSPARPALTTSMRARLGRVPRPQLRLQLRRIRGRGNDDQAAIRTISPRREPTGAVTSPKVMLSPNARNFVREIVAEAARRSPRRCRTALRGGHRSPCTAPSWCRLGTSIPTSRCSSPEPEPLHPRWSGAENVTATGPPFCDVNARLAGQIMVSPEVGGGSDVAGGVVDGGVGPMGVGEEHATTPKKAAHRCRDTPRPEPTQ